EVNVVDPACGSGAYLLGVLHELHALTRLLDTRAEQPTARSNYRRKLQIIQHNLYGVDIDEFAVNIARLRLWLSLAVEYEGETPEPLPNLDFKIERGDSLTAPDPRMGIQRHPLGGDAGQRRVPPEPRRGFDIIITNPPYLSTKHGFGKTGRDQLTRL